MDSIRQTLENVPPNKLAYRFFPGYIALDYPGYRFAAHNKLIAKALMKIESGEINRLIVTMPPRHGKTMQISEYFPPWFLGRNPHKQIISVAYSYERAADSGRKVRNHMINPMHPRIFSGCSLSLDSKSIHKLSTDQGGSYFSVGIGGAIVGRGSHLLIIDDPIRNREEADSESSREKMINWFRGVAYTRLMPGNSAIIIVMTRWHYDDLVGYVLEELAHENWVTLNLAAVCDSPDDDLLQRDFGDPLWDDTEYGYPLKKLHDIKATIGTREWNAQYQQTPLPSEGGIINLSWFKKYDYSQWAAAEIALKLGGEPPIPFGIRRIVMSWDTAFKESQLNDPSACTIWGETGNKDYYLLNIVNERMKYPKLKKTVVETWQKYMKCDIGPIPVLIEDRASGQSLIQDLKMQTPIPVIARPADANKKIRLDSASPLIEAGRVYIPERCRWIVEYETEMARFPLWKFDNLVDSTSQFLSWAGKPKYRKSKKRRFWK